MRDLLVLQCTYMALSDLIFYDMIVFFVKFSFFLFSFYDICHLFGE